MTAPNQDLLKRLQKMKRLVERACAERDLALTEASLWKQRYETEAHQRRLERSQSALLEPQSFELDQTDGPEGAGDNVIRLKQELAQARQALQQEKEEHQKTRTSLITVLGDALQRKSSQSSPR